VNPLKKRLINLLGSSDNLFNRVRAEDAPSVLCFAVGALKSNGAALHLFL